MDATATLQAINNTLYKKLTDPSEHLLIRRALDRWVFPRHRPLNNDSPETLDATLEALYMPLEAFPKGSIDLKAIQIPSPPAIETTDESFAYTLSQVREGTYSAVNGYFFKHFRHLIANEEEPC